MQKGQPQKGGGKGSGRREHRAEGTGPKGPGGRQKGRRAQKGRDGEIPSRRFVLLLPCLPLDALTGSGSQECAFLNKPASRPDSSPAGPWGSPPASRKNSHFCGAPYCITGARSESGPRQGSHGGPLDALQAASRRKTLFLNRPASRPDSSPAGPWESPPVPAKISIFAGPPIASPGPEMNPGPGKGLTGDPWTP